MRWMLMLMLMLPVVFMTGCLSDDERAFFIRQGEVLERRIAEYEVLLDKTEASITEVKARIESKDIDIASGLSLVNDLKEQYADYKRMIKEDQDRSSDIDDRLRDKGAGEKWEALGWTVLSIAGALAGVRIQRGASSKAHKTPDGKLMDSGRARSG